MSAITIGQAKKLSSKNREYFDTRSDSLQDSETNRRLSRERKQNERLKCDENRAC